VHRLSPAYLALKKEAEREAMGRERKARLARQPEVLAAYEARMAEREAVIARVEKRFRKPFREFTRKDYAAWMEGLDLGRDEDLFAWSHVTGIPVLALSRTSSFFSSNTHLLADVEAALRMTRRESYALKTEADKETLQPIVKDASGRALPLRDLPEAVLLPTGRTHGFWHFADFVEGRTQHAVLAPFLIPFGDLPYRDAIDGWIRALPLSVVQVYRGKGIYFTPLPGRSFAPTMPCSNTTYKSNVGMQTGLWIEIRSGPLSGTAQNFVHEFGHILDYVILQGGYGGYRAPHQFPGFRKALPAKERVFGIRDDKVPQTPYGYVSRYARTNAQESFAEHFRAYVLEREAFRTKAEAEDAQGHPELMRKYRFMERLLDETPTRLRRLSPAFLEQDARWSDTRGRIRRLEKAREVLGAEAPKAIDGLIEALMATAFEEQTKRAAAAEAALVRKVTRAVRRVRDRERADQALAAILGMTLELKADRGATSGAPAFTATVRGADEGTVKGTLRIDAHTPGRLGPPAEAGAFELSAGSTRRLRWTPEAGEDLAPFVAVATAELEWDKRRFVLTSQIACRPSIPAWNVVGPFANPGGATGDVAHPPEAGVDLAATYAGAGGRALAWTACRRPDSARLDAEFVLDLAARLGAHEDVAAYAVVWAHAPKAMDARLALGSADGAVAWVNGERVFAWLEGRRAYRSRAHSVPIRLRKGANEILVKVTLASKAWRFCAHLTAPDGGPLGAVRYTLEP
jgi:hypothetical protein